MTKIQELKKKMADLKEEMTKEAKAVFKDAAAELFDKYPAMESFGYDQYTIYFNDGDELYFTAYTDADCIRINGIRGDDEEDGKLPRAAYDKVSELLGEIGEDCLLAMFGDHCHVTAKKDGVTVDSYTDHD
jgi:hypothetical protein